MIFYLFARKRNSYVSFHLTLLDGHNLVCESSSTISAGIKSHRLVLEFGHEALRCTEIVAVSILVLIHLPGVFSNLRIFHKVGLRCHVGVRLCCFDRLTFSFGHITSAFSCLRPDEIGRCARVLIATKTSDVMLRELSSLALRIETSIGKSIDKIPLEKSFMNTYPM